MNLGELRRAALGQYTGNHEKVEDDLFTQPILDDIVNARHRWFAREALCYRETQTYTLTAGTMDVPLNCNVIQILPRTVRLKVSGVYRELIEQEESELLARGGPFEETDRADPWAYFTKAGSVVEQTRVLGVFPPPISNLASALKLEAYIYPGLLTADNLSPAIQPAEHHRLLPAICWGMAELEASRGRADAPVDYWRARAREDCTAIRDTVSRFKRSGPRRIRHIRRYD